MEDLPKGLANSGAVKIGEQLRSISGGKVLDVATQKGDFINTLMTTLKDYDSFVGIDISFKEIESLRKEFEKQPVKFIEMNAEIMEFKNDSFDTVSIAHSLHHLEKINEVLSEMKRVLKPDGYFIIQEPFCDGVQTEAQLTDIGQHHWGSKIDTLLNIPHTFTFSKQKTEKFVRKVELRELITIESSHFVKCLYCEEKFNCEDPKNEEIINYVIKGIDRDLKRLLKLKDHPEYKNLKEEGELLKERVRRTGSASASHLFFIGKK
ncbi:MAG: class I SAM-dependent methyltransferase [Promethearchaeota archaeon]